MPIITIPKTLPPSEKLVVIPQKAYEEFLKWQKMVKAMRTFMPTHRELQDLVRARKDFKSGKYIKWQELKHELANLRTRKSKKTA